MNYLKGVLMATIKQINANRKNALLSKGPKTDLGKLNSSKNSLKHGLTAKQLVIGEDLKEFEQYRDLMIEALKPEGILEEQERARYNRETFERERRYIYWVNPSRPINQNKLGSSQQWRIEKKHKYYD